MFPYCPGVQRQDESWVTWLWKEVMTLPNTPQSLDRFERLLETLEFREKWAAACDRYIGNYATLAHGSFTSIIPCCRAILMLDVDLDVYRGIRPPFMTFCASDFISSAKIKNQIGKLPISLALKIQLQIEDEKSCLSQVFSVHHYLLMLATSHV